MSNRSTIVHNGARFARLFLFVAACLGAARSSVHADDALFAGRAIHRIAIQVDEKQLEKLRADPRAYVKATLREGDNAPIADVALKLKGAAGSFRDWDDRPALTLNMRKYRKGSRFHGLVKFHLNNSVQDETYLNELICAELFRKAGIPAPRVAHARVTLNGRDVGLYVLKEGFDESFLKRSFPDPSGNLYDSGFLQDLNGELEKDEGSGPDDRSDLRAVVEAATDPDPIARVRRLEALVDLEEFFTFMAMERMLCHWDGYANNANNYRVYFNPKTGKAMFLPHGMDQMWGEIGMGLFDDSDKLMTAAVIQSNALRGRYRKRVDELLPLVSPPDAILKRIDEVSGTLRPFFEEQGAEQKDRYAQLVKELKERVVARSENLVKQAAEPDPSLQEFDERGVTPLEGWWAAPEGEKVTVDEVQTTEGKKLLHVKAGEGEPGIGSWRLHVLLGPGTYLLKADAKTSGVVKLDETEDSGVGAGESGVARDQHIHGDHERKALSYRFEVREDRKRVELILEMRARSGEAWFDAQSLRLIREEKRDR